MTLKIGALFAGYGGLDLATEMVLPAQLAWVSEIEAAPTKILAHHYPDVPNLGDITKIDWTQVEPVDIITGGSPCQDLSHAGRRAGMKTGTRSGLWASMCDAIETIKPRLVIWENVQGALSAEATIGDLESCEFCVDGTGGGNMRALGRVLGDLVEIGYHAAWTGLRAADVGAPHPRFRVFVLAWPATDTRGDGWGPARFTTTGEEESGRASTVDSGRDRTPINHLLPTPRATDGTKGGPNQRGSKGDLMLPSAVMTLLPTPSVNDMGAAYTPDEWDAWTAKMKASHGNGNGHGKSLNIEALRLLRTPCADEAGGGPLHPDTAKERNQTLRLTGQVLAATGYMAAPDGTESDTWGDYEPAINRWEQVFGRTAPAPTVPAGRGGKHQLSAAFVEWMMGLPDGWVTDPNIGISRNNQLKALGNGVVPQQAAWAIQHLLTIREHFLKEQL